MSLIKNAKPSHDKLHEYCVEGYQGCKKGGISVKYFKQTMLNWHSLNSLHYVHAYTPIFSYIEHKSQNYSIMF